MFGRKIHIIGSILAAALLFLIFFSKTLYSYNLPTVSAVLPVNSKLNKLETSKGIAEWASISELYSEIPGKVEKILVDEGERVKEGQELIYLSFDDDDIERALKELDISRNKLLIETENIQLRLDKISYSIFELEEELYEKEEVSDYELTQLGNRITKREEDYEKSKQLYEAGALAKQELEAIEYELQDLKAQYENLQVTLAEQNKKIEEAVDDKEKNRQKQLRDYQYEVLGLEQDLKTKNLELNNLALQEEKHKKTLADYNESAVIYARAEAMIVSIPVKQGQYIGSNSLMLSLGAVGEYNIICDISGDNNFVAPGDTCVISNSSHTFEGVVTKITPSDAKKQVKISIDSEEISAGETFDITFEKESTESYILVPNGAVNKDSDGYFLYQIKRRDGIMGKEYYAEKVRIYIGDSDNDNTVVVKGVTFFEPVIMLSDKSFAEGDTLILANEGDFFAVE